MEKKPNPERVHIMKFSVLSLTLTPTTPYLLTFGFFMLLDHNNSGLLYWLFLFPQRAIRVTPSLKSILCPSVIFSRESTPITILKIMACNPLQHWPS